MQLRPTIQNNYDKSLGLNIFRNILTSTMAWELLLLEKRKDPIRCVSAKRYRLERQSEAYEHECRFHHTLATWLEGKGWTATPGLLSAERERRG